MDWRRVLTAIGKGAQIVGGLVVISVLLVLFAVLMLVLGLLIPDDPFWRAFLATLLATPWIPYAVCFGVCETWQSGLRQARDEPVHHHHFPKSAQPPTRRERLRVIASNTAFVGVCVLVAGVFVFGLRREPPDVELGMLMGALIGIPLGFCLGLWHGYRHVREFVRRQAWREWHAGGKELYERGQRGTDG